MTAQIEGRVGVSVAASIEAVPTGGHPSYEAGIGAGLRARSFAGQGSEIGLRTVNPQSGPLSADQCVSHRLRILR